MELFEAVKTGNREIVKALIESGAEVNRQDKQGWTALNWAAAGGKVEMIELLLENGADPFAVGRDLRTPLMIALAAGQAEAVRVLRRAEAQAENGGAAQPERKYAAAYHLEELRRYPGWPAAVESGAESNGGQPEGAADGDVVFIHQDYKVMKSIWPDENVLFADVTEQWKDYCRNELKFSVPDDLDLIDSPAGAPTSAA
jgi:ankyrin repeat protein